MKKLLLYLLTSLFFVVPAMSQTTTIRGTTDRSATFNLNFAIEIETSANQSGFVEIADILEDDNFKLFDNVDLTKIAEFQLSGITTATTRTYTFPDADGTFLLDSSSLAGLGGELADEQPVGVENTGTLVGTRSRLNFEDGASAGIDLTITDDAGNDEIDIAAAVDLTEIQEAFEDQMDALLGTNTGNITYTYSDGGNSIDLTFIEAQLIWGTITPPDGQPLASDSFNGDGLNFSAGEGIDITGTAATDFLAFTLDFTEVTDESGVAGSDTLLFWDIDAGALREATVDQVLTGGGVVNIPTSVGEAMISCNSGAGTCDAEETFADVIAVLGDQIDVVSDREWSPITEDLTIGDDTDEGQIKIGNSWIGQADDTISTTVFDDVLFIYNNSDSIEDISIMMVGPSDVPRFVLAEEGADLATYNPRSMVIGPAATLGNVDENIQCSTNFSSIDCDTGTSGADLGVQDDVEIGGDLFCTDCIDEVELNALDAAGDEECLTWEATGSQFEWQSCSGGGGEANTASNVGGGLANFNQKSGVDLEFNTFAAADFDLATNVISIDDATWLNETELNTFAELDAQIADVTLVHTSDTATFTNKTLDAGGTGNVVTLEDGTAPVADNDGEVVVDETAHQVVFQSDGTDYALPSEICEAAVIENLAAADDDFEITMKAYPITVTQIGLHCAGTCTTGADISLEDRSGNAMTHTVPTHSTGTSNTTFQSVTAANTLVSGEALRFDVDNAVSPETDTYTISYCYTVDRQ